MKGVKIFKECVTLLENRDFKKLSKHISDDFRFSGAVPNPIGKQEWIDFLKALTKGLPDFSLNLSDADSRVEEQSGKVYARYHITGTHSGPLDLPFLGISAPATGKKVSLPQERMTVHFDGDKIREMHVDPSPGGGMEGLLQQLGIAVPIST